MMCSADEAQFMRLLLQLINAKKVIEIGKVSIMFVKWPIDLRESSVMSCVS